MPRDEESCSWLEEEPLIETESGEETFSMEQL